MSNFISRWFNKISIASKLYFTVGIMAVLIATELLTLWFSISTLSSIRGYVGAEGLWSKAEKDAVYHLSRYYRSHGEADYAAFINFMKVPLSDHEARIELLKQDPDLDIVRNGLIGGRNHSDDVNGMIKLFRRFHTISYINRAIVIWSEGDTLIAKLIPIGEQLHAEINSPASSKEKADQIMAPVDGINQQLTALEDDFSFTLGEGSRWLENLILKLLFGVALTVEISGLLLTITVSRGITRGVKEIVGAARSIAKGNFNAKAKSFSQDEIGLLAHSFNRMADDLRIQSVSQARAEEELKQQKELYETLINAQSEMGEGMAITEGSRIIYANDALCKMYGYDREEILSMTSFVALVIEEDRERITKRLQERFSGSHMSDMGETAIKRKDGSILYIEYSLKKTEIKGKTQLISIIRDISRRKEAEREILRSNKELEHFAYIASHDLKEPLRAVSSYLQLLQRRYKERLDKDANEYINFAVDGAGRMGDLINDLLKYSQVGSQLKQFTIVDYNEVLGTVARNLKSTIDETKTQLVVDPLPALKADETQMRQLFQNLISNAIKFKSEKTPRIKISANKKEGHYLFAVEDNGIGIPKEYEEKIFELFQRLNSKSKYPGTGIGLAVCKKIVELHGGEIWIEPNENKGTTFYFTIRA